MYLILINMKYIKTIIGILLIATAVFAMYYWNSRGRENMQEKSNEEITAENTVIEHDPKEKMLNMGYSYFPISTEDIELKSSLLKAGDYIGIYYKVYPDVSENEIIDIDKNKYELIKIGKYETAYTDSSIVEIKCSLDDYREIDIITKNDNKLTLVLEASDE